MLQLKKIFQFNIYLQFYNTKQFIRAKIEFRILTIYMARISPCVSGINTGSFSHSVSVLLLHSTHQHATKGFRKSCQEVWQGRQGHHQGRQEEEEAEKEGVLRYLHLQGVEAGPP